MIHTVVFGKDDRGRTLLADIGNGHRCLTKGGSVLEELLDRCDLQDPDDVTQHPEGHHRIDSALVLEEKVDQKRPVTAIYMEEQIRFAASEL